MVQSDISRAALDLPPEDRLELARLLVESVASPAELDERIKEGIQRIEDIATGNVQGLTEEQFNAMLRK
jgi:putative addiction module component (TIGR02574 family)